jgi:CheY-like chemotaxis protein
MCHVLIIEDEAMIAMLLQDVLEEAGATSFAFAATEDDAVWLALQRAPDVIASDVQLVEGTGLGAVQRIHANVGEIPVLFITGTPTDCLPRIPQGIVLTKPVSTLQIITAFQQIAPS